MKRLPVLGVGTTALPEERADAARNRQKILTALRETLKTKAMRDICMDELAQLAGVGKGTLYRRFADRAALCMAALDEAERDLQNRVLSGFGLTKGASPTEAFQALFAALFEFAFEHADLLGEAIASMRDPSDRFRGPPYSWRRRLLLRRLGEMGHTKSAETVADTLLAMLDPGLLRLRREKGETREAVYADLAHVVSRLVG